MVKQIRAGQGLPIAPPQRMLPARSVQTPYPHPVVEVSSAGRVVYPTTGTTKGEVVAHYSAVGERLLHHIIDRPLTLQRFPRGVAGQGFMQKNAADYFPDYIGRHVVERQDGTTNHPVVTTVAGIEYLANQNTITFHIPTTTITAPNYPDRFIIDLDPPEGSVAIVREAALLTRELFEGIGVPTTPVATGSKGYHLTAMISPTLTVPEVDELGQLAAAVLSAQHPDVLTTEFRKANRQGRVFCDWLRNRWGSTSVAPWSLRPRLRPTVAVPFDWSELDTIAPDTFAIGELPSLDLLARAAESPVDLRPALESLREAAAGSGVTIEPFDRFRS